MRPPQPRRTSRLIFDERPLMVPPSLAAAIGLNEAIFIQQLHYWINEATAGRDIEGRRWIYNTYEAWSEQFPFWSIATIRRIIGSLEKSGYLLSSEAFNAHASNRTKWYTLDYDAIEQLATQLPPFADRLLNVSSPAAQPMEDGLLTLSSSIKETETTSKRTPERDLSKGPSKGSGENWGVVDTGLVERYIRDYSAEFGDEAATPVSVARAGRLWARAGVDQDQFVSALYEARARTKRFTGAIAKQRGDGNGKNKMPYFFEVLEDQLGLRATS